MRGGEAASEREFRSIVHAGGGGGEEQGRKEAAGGTHPLADQRQQKQHNSNECERIECADFHSEHLLLINYPYCSIKYNNHDNHVVSTSRLAAVCPPPRPSALPTPCPSQLHLTLFLFVARLLLRLGRVLAGYCCGGLLLLFAGGGLEVVDDLVKEVLYIGVGLGRDLLIELGLLLGEILCHSASFAEDFGL